MMQCGLMQPVAPEGGFGHDAAGMRGRPPGAERSGAESGVFSLQAGEPHRCTDPPIPTSRPVSPCVAFAFD